MRLLNRPQVVLGLAFAGLLVAANASKPEPARAIPLFSRQYGVTCEKCHSVIPHLNEFGAAFLAYGERFPGVASGPTVPISAKVNLVGSSERQGDGPDGAGLPKAIVDEVELFTTGTIGSRSNYFVEQYLVDGGEPGLLHDAWIQDRLDPWQSKIPLAVQAGQFILPQPVDPETFRDSYQDYSPLTQTVGGNAFFWKDPKIGVRFEAGDPLRGPSLQLFAGPGHDRQSGLPSSGIDTEVYVQEGLGRAVLSGFRYDGTRPVPGALDRFERSGVGFTYGQWSRFSSETVLTNGWDSNCATAGLTGCTSSGGFEQLRYAFDRRLYALGRYEGTNDPTNGFTRDAVLMLGYGPTENSRVTLEDVVRHVPQTTHTVNLQFTIGY